MTLEKARVKLGKRESTMGLTFVALSRVRRMEDLLIDCENFETSCRLTNIKLPSYVKDFDNETLQMSEETEVRFRHLL